MYCPLILSCAPTTAINKILILQKKAIRSITNSPYNSHTAPLFLSLNILPFDKIIYLQKALFMHSIHYKYQHVSFNTTWNLNINREYDHTLRNLNDFYLPLPRTDAFKRSTLYNLPKTWNELPNEIKCHNNRFTFNICLKNEIFRQMGAGRQT